MTFDDLGLDPNVLKAVREAGYETPTPIQKGAIPEALKARDVLGIAQTGTGKTASFTLPMITILNQGRARARMPRSLILCPTRELAAQVAENFDTYGKYCKLTKALLIGGVSFKDQDQLIDRGVDVLIATPGRLLDHFERGKLMLTGIEIMVVDEADRMLDMGFIPDIERIFKLTPFTRQTLFFSATMPPEITKLTQEFLHTPVRIEVAAPATTAETVEQSLVKLRPPKRDAADGMKRDALRALLKVEDVRNAIIFCNRKRDVSVVYKSLEKHGFNVGALHGDLDQSIRMRVLDGFRTGAITFLVASDVAARGLDIPNVSHVFNYDVPINAEDYVHRIGRTGRAGRTGKSISLALPADDKHVEKIEKLIGKPITEASLPAGFAPPAAEPAEAAEEDSAPRRRRSRRDEPRADAKATAPAEPLKEAPSRAEREAPRRDAPGRDGARRDADRSRGDRRGRGEGRRDEPVVGLGDHVPAFLLREVPPPKRASRRTAADEEEGAEEAA